MCNSADLQGFASLVSSMTSGSGSLFASSFAGFPELWGEGFDGEILFRAECSLGYHSAYCLAVSLCICSHLLQEEVSLRMAEQGTDL